MVSWLCALLNGKSSTPFHRIRSQISQEKYHWWKLQEIIADNLFTRSLTTNILMLKDRSKRQIICKRFVDFRCNAKTHS